MAPKRKAPSNFTGQGFVLSSGASVKASPKKGQRTPPNPDNDYSPVSPKEHTTKNKNSASKFATLRDLQDEGLSDPDIATTPKKKTRIVAHHPLLENGKSEHKGSRPRRFGQRNDQDVTVRLSKRDLDLDFEPRVTRPKGRKADPNKATAESPESVDRDAENSPEALAGAANDGDDLAGTLRRGRKRDGFEREFGEGRKVV